ncbi:MAG: endonuclease [Methylobacterium sp.]|nr:endonuclease [Methylobacterium sp.]
MPAFWHLTDASPELLQQRIDALSMPEPNSGCILWFGTGSRSGYGLISLPKPHGRQVFAHRLAYELAVGEIQAGLVIDHLCRTPRCINPAHMEPVTLGVNTLRGVGITAAQARQTHCKRGHPLSGSNLYRMPDNGRVCITCRRATASRFRARKRARLIVCSAEGRS